MEHTMRTVLRTLALVLVLFGIGTGPLAAQQQPPATYQSSDLVSAGHHFFGEVSRGLAQIIEQAISNWGQPNGYILGQEASGAFVAGLRYGEGTLYTRNAGDLRVYWQGPSLGFDLGGEGARTMMLVYNLPRRPLPSRPLDEVTDWGRFFCIGSRTCTGCERLVEIIAGHIFPINMCIH